jgi:phospholipase/carboxylesterase
MAISQPRRDGPSDPHADQPTLAAGSPVEDAELVLLLIHGRGASAEGMLPLLEAIGLERVAALAPQAAGGSWYPQSFLAPLEANQPFLDSALGRIERLVNEVMTRGTSSERISLLGFSQGACLTLEFVARHPRRYGAVIGLTGGLIGPPGTPRNYPGSMAGVPIFLGSGDPDPHVPFERVRETEAVLSRMGAGVQLRRYPGMPHTINDDELDASRELLRRAIKEQHDGQ